MQQPQIEHVVLNEVYAAIQGEGPFMGRPVVFLRTYGCNLQCDWCDTPYTWDAARTDSRKDVNRLTLSEAADLVREQTSVYLTDAATIIATGGEPLLQQKGIVRMLTEKLRHGYLLQWETNGTIVPSKETIDATDAFIVSVKLAGSMGKRGFNTEERRIRPQAIITLRDTGKAFWKFVIDTEEDESECLELIRSFRLPRDRVYVMPQGITRERIARESPRVMDFALKNGINFTSRLHVIAYGNRRAV